MGDASVGGVIMSQALEGVAGIVMGEREVCVLCCKGERMVCRDDGEVARLFDSPPTQVVLLEAL